MANQIPIPIVGNYPRVTTWIKTPTKTFSESHWYGTVNPYPGSSTAGTPGNVFNRAVLNLWNSLALLRTAMYADNCYTIAIRVSSENLYKDSAVYTRTAPPIFSGDPVNPENEGNDCLNIRFESTDLYRRIAYLGAVPDVNISNDQYINTGDGQIWDSLAFQYLSALAVGPTATFGTGTGASVWGFLAISKSPTLAPRCMISSIVISATNPQTCTVTTTTPNLLLPNGVVRLSYVPGANALTPWNQLWYVDTINLGANSFALKNFPFAPSTAGLVNPPGGYAMAQYKVFQPYTNYTIEPQAGSRKRGGRAFLRLGRVKRKKTVGY